MADEATHKIAKIEIDPSSLAATTADAEHERRAAIYDLIEENRFRIVDVEEGPYHVKLSTLDNRLVLDVSRIDDREAVRTIMLSLAPFRGVIRDYFMICESYYDAIRNGSIAQIEAVDMGRRGLHNEGSTLLTDRLEGKIELDFDTARRLFTLICALHRPR